MADSFREEERFSSKFNGKTLFRVFQLLAPYRWGVVIFIGSFLIVSMMDNCQFYISKLLVDDGIMANNRAEIIRLIKLFIGLFVVQAVFFFLSIYLNSMIGEKLLVDLRMKLFNHLQELSLSYFSVTPVGWIMSRVNSDTYRIIDLITWGLSDTVFAIVSVFVTFFFMLKINVKMTLLVIMVFPLMIWAAWQFRKRILSQYRIVRRLNSKVAGAFNEMISGIRVIKGLHRESENLREFDEITSPMFKSAYSAGMLNALFLPCIQVISSIALALIIYMSGIQVGTNFMTIGGIQAFVNYVFSIMWPIQDIARIYGEMQQSIASAERVFSLLDATPSIADIPGAVPLNEMIEHIEFKDVSFYYDDAPEQIVLENFSLDVKKGEMVALVGPTGGGKTTIVNLLGRFYEPKKGDIEINGLDYRHFQTQSVQSKIGIVLQTPHLFSGTIRDNIRYGNLNATDEQIEAAARTVGADAFIREFPKGYEEPVGESGSHLSVGQKQLISIVRAFLVNPSVFIMDEATSSVDSVSEFMIQKGMEKMMTGRISFIIAHRLSTIRKADCIYYIEDGKIVEHGTHRELLRLKGKYYFLYTRQFRNEEFNKMEI